MTYSVRASRAKIEVDLVEWLDSPEEALELARVISLVTRGR